MSWVTNAKSKIKKMMPASLWWELRKCKTFVTTISGRIESIVVSVGQACNFECRDCGNFAPYSPEKYKRYSIDSIINSLEIIFNNVKSVGCIQIQGGEPFLYTELDKLIEYLGSKKTASGGVLHDILIATNGSIMPSESLLRVMRENDVYVRISDYNIVHDKAFQLKKKCEKMGIRCSYYKFVGDIGKWNLLGGIEVTPEDNDKVVANRFKKCNFHGCLTLERGELSYCSRATNSHVIQHFKRKKGDYLKVRDTREFGKLLRRYIIHAHAMEACRYCNGTDSDHIVEPAIQIVTE